eukprot:TRINITY_DN1802_c0_g1_i2.p1 TRINITY_DN1802_c0_g1~~TRINITY_DN1802_c0_g1_i2.p1  ORF type:complete len:263 (+),score=93.87 TRINITY_DN1802_c0_g1_i2:44-790(+)
MGASSSQDQLWKEVISDGAKQAQEITQAVSKKLALQPTQLKSEKEKKDLEAKAKQLAEEEAKKFETKNVAMLNKIFLTYDADKSGKLEQKEEAKKFETKNVAMLNKIFLTYDADKSGKLEQKEVVALFKESLNAQKKFLPDEVDMIINIAKRTAMEAARAQTQDIDILKSVEQMLDESLANVKKKTATALGKLIDSCIADSDKLGVSMFERMDKNQDKSVSKEEFLKNYNNAARSLFNVQEFVSKFKM